MCGISACYNHSEAILKTYQILCNQEERGKDATGLAFLNEEGIQIIKRAVAPTQFKQYITSQKVTVAIGHNRHATSNLENKHLDTEAHPFISEDKSFALAHNGTVSNYEIIKELLELLGNHTFSTGIDSEIYVHLLEELLARYPRIKALKKLYYWSSGTLLILFKDGELIAMGGKALVIAQSEDTVLIASELNSLLPLLHDNAKIAEVEFNSEYSIARIKTVKNKPRVYFYGDWDTFKLDKPEGFNPVTKAMCDFCKTASVFCERIKVNGSEKDRYVNCFRKNVTELPKKDYRPIHPSYKYIQVIYERCSGYKHMVKASKLLYCPECGRNYCKGCFRDSRRHTCKRIFKHLNGIKAVHLDGWW